MKYRLFFWSILITGLALRLYHAWTAPFAYVNSDTCNIWLMAKHILHGEFPLFFYGQYYLGPMEALTVAFFFMLFGIKISTLYFGTIFYSALFMVSAYFLGKELKDRTVGIVMMLYSAFPPSYFFCESIAPLGYHIEILFLGNMIFILTLKIPKILRGARKTVCYILLGLCAGMGVWTHYIILYYLIPSALYLVLNEKWKDLLKRSIPAMISFFLIALPFWIFTFRYNFATFKFKSQSGQPGAMLNFSKLLVKHISRMFNIDYDFNSLIGISKFIVLCIYIISILYFIWKFFTARPFLKSAESIFMYLFIFMLVFYAGYRAKIYAGEGYNYIIPVITFVSAAFGYFAGSLINRFRIAGLCVILLVISFNTRNIWTTMSERRSLSDSSRQAVYGRIKYLEDNKIYRFIGHEGYGRVPAFFSDEKIIVTGFSECGYPPYEYMAEASDRIAFEKCGSDWRPTLDNICQSYDFKSELFCDFKPFPYKTKVIKPCGWRAFSNSNSHLAHYAYDRNYDEFWVTKGGKKTGMYFTIDIGSLYKICKIELFNADRYWNNPISCKIQASIDGINWADIAYIEKIQSLFWSGPRPYWRIADSRLEWFFKPVSARFIRLMQIGEDIKNPWVINEIFLYEYMRNEELRIRDYVKDAKDIVRFSIKKNKNFVYADFYLSAKIRELSKNKIEALVPYNSFLPPRKNMNREVQIGSDRVFIVRAGDTDEIEAILSEFGLPYKKNYFKNYVCCYFDNLAKQYESIHSLMWIGVGLVKHSLKDYSMWLYNQGEYEKALKYYPNNFTAYLKCKTLPRTRFFPETEKNISFINGIKFLGYSIRGGKFKPGGIIRMEYFWETQDEPSRDLSVFVYFIKDGKIVFQNDHRFLYQFPRPLRPLEGERFREVLKLKLPNDLSSGNYQIIIGLWNKNTGKRVKIKGPSGKKISKQIIGELVIP